MVLLWKYFSKGLDKCVRMGREDIISKIGSNSYQKRKEKKRPCIRIHILVQMEVASTRLAVLVNRETLDYFTPSLMAFDRMTLFSLTFSLVEVYKKIWVSIKYSSSKIVNKLR